VISAKDSINFYEAYGFQINEKPIKKIAAYITKEKEDNEEKTETIWQSYELKIEPKKTEKNIPEYPDLIVIDGGKGQLSSVLKILDPIMKSIDFDQNKEASWNFDITKNVIALAKREEEVFRGTVNEKNKVEFEQLDINANSAASKLLQRTRDEAHRFAITFNRNLRAKAAMKSILDEIPGIGGRSKKKLLQTFGSVSGIREASDEEILGIVTQKQLESLRKQL
jgi:excinuclease UvrABC nuclease subunit